jgi:serine/threonine-protein kinase RsbW
VPTSTEHTLTVDASLDSLHDVRDFLTTAGTQLDIDQEVIADLHLAVDEAVTNIIMHGYAGRPGRIIVAMARDDAEVVVRLSDDAPLYDPSSRQSPELDSSPLDRAAAGGFGVELIRRSVDDLHYQVVDQRNQLTLVKKVPIQSI